MRPTLLVLAAGMLLTPSAVVAQSQARPAGLPVLDNAQVRVFEGTSPSLARLDHAAGVIVILDAESGHAPGDAFWADDVALAGKRVGRSRAVVVVPKRAGAAPGPPPSDASKPGEGTFTGMSFRPLFENERVAVIRARMDVGAREALHTHASDTIVVHLSGGQVEDTPEGGTATVNRWSHGDVEFEARGSSHTMRNVGDAVDVVLVTLKPLTSRR